MRVLVLFSLVGVALAAPQGYNYQLHVGPSDGSDFTYEQLQLLTQLAGQQQQQQPQIIAISADSAPDAATLSQSVLQGNDNNGYQYANQLVQQAQQLVSYENQQQLQQQPQLQIQLQQQPQQQPQLQLQQQPQVQLQQQQPQLQLQQQQLEQPLAAVSNAELAAALQAPAAQEVQLQPQPQPQEQQEVVREQQQQQHHVETVHEQVQSQPQPQPQQERQVQPSAQPQLIAAPQPHYEPQTHYQRTSESAPAPVQFNKEFFYLSAPQEDFEPSQDFQDQLNKIKKNLRVVFIKAPEQNGLEKAALQLAKGAYNAQTAIYVLQKQHDAGDLASKLQQIRATAQHKPEVIFVKYRTPEEASHAQRTIQAQYEALDGPNNFNYEGVVPSHNFIGSTGAIEPRKRLTTTSATGSAVKSAATAAAPVIAPVAKYLPASVAKQ